jgi:exodeoxyribonuclease V alpha subunit
MLFLHAHKVSTNLALKIYKQYGDDALEVINENPYQLANDIHGVGFKIADKIAQDLGLPHDHPARISAGVLFVLQEAVSNGHVYFPEEAVIERSADLLQVESALIPDSLLHLQTERHIEIDRVFSGVAESGAGDSGPQNDSLSAIYLKPYHFAEIETAKRLFNLSNVMLSRLSDVPPAFTVHADSLTTHQLNAVKTSLSHPVSVLTGGPGTGKTTTLKALIEILDSANKRYALASPTGRAAKRLSQAVGRPASTIHRLLGYSPKEGYKHDDERPLNVDIVVVDEASMIDLTLMYHLLKAIPIGAHLLLVGDVDQLPSVGAGDVLRDIIASEISPVTRLDTIFRQAQDSLIIANAHRINHGDMPLFPKDGSDFFFFPSDAPEETAQWILDVTSERIPRRFELDARDDIQVLSPMYRGPSGVDALNKALQEKLNPPRKSRAERVLFGHLFREDDKVMQTQNNYDKEVFNGDIGRITEISEPDHTLTVAFDDRQVPYDWNEVDQLVLAYAISVHKSQGAEFPAVVVPVITQHYLMLQRNLLYTAISRAQKLCVLVGTKKAIGIAVKNDKVARRHSALAPRLAAQNS